MNRIIINNRTELTDIQAMEYVLGVIKMGRISGMTENQYCYLTSFKKEGIEYHVVTDLRKKSDSFTLYKLHQT